MKNITICLYGASSDQINPDYIREVEYLGRKIAMKGHSLIYGGGSTGLMGACARGVTENKGTVISVLPSFMEKYEGIYREASQMILTETMSERKDIMESRADAFIIVPGGVGTMDEFFEIITLVELGQKNAPVVLFNMDGFYDDIISFIKKGHAKGFIRDRLLDSFCVKYNADDVLACIEANL